MSSYLDIQKNIQIISEILKECGIDEEIECQRFSKKSESFSDPKEAIKSFDLFKGIGWLCVTSSSKIIEICNAGECLVENAGWPIEGEKVSDDKTKSISLTRKSNEGWVITHWEISTNENDPQYLLLKRSLRRLNGGKLIYQVAYSMNPYTETIEPAWARFIGFEPLPSKEY